MILLKYIFSAYKYYTIEHMCLSIHLQNYLLNNLYIPISYKNLPNSYKSFTPKVICDITELQCCNANKFRRCSSWQYAVGIGFYGYLVNNQNEGVHLILHSLIYKTFGIIILTLKKSSSH